MYLLIIHIFHFFSKWAHKGPVSVFFIFVFSFLSSNAQDYRYDRDLPSKEFHKARRQALRELLPEASVAVFFSSNPQIRSNDVEFPFHQDPDFYYLSGCLEAESVLLIFKDKQKIGDESSDEMIFVSPRDSSKEVWTGPLLGIEGTKKFLGFENPHLNIDFKDIQILFSQFKTIFYKSSDEQENKNASIMHPVWNSFVTKAAISTAKNTDSRNLSGFMAQLREKKKVEEIKLIRKAIEITGVAHISNMRSLRPGSTEYQVQAQVEFIFKKSGCESPAFPSIVGGGKNSCILHYETNRKPFKDGEIVVVDIGGEYHGYAADITRTLPVNGTFSAEQKQIYELVLSAQEAGIKACLPGNEFGAPGKQAKNIISKGLKDLGIIRDSAEYSKYFMHGTSHYLGLDVHDIGNYEKLSAGNIITVEPGIYIPEGSNCDPKWWNIGVRIEDDILITNQEPENLSIKSPRTVLEIEKLMSHEVPKK